MSDMHILYFVYAAMLTSPLISPTLDFCQHAEAVSGAAPRNSHSYDAKNVCPDGIGRRRSL